MIGIGLLAGLGFYVSRPKPQAVPPAETVAEGVSSATSNEAQAVKPIAARRDQPPPLREPHRVAKPSEVAASGSIPAIDASVLTHLVDVLVSPQASHQQKQEAWKQLRDAGKLDLAIADLEKRVASDPHVAEYPAALGNAYLQKCGLIKDVREQGILAMQADKLFDTALSLDPLNWDARFTKAVAMSYWPPMLNKGEEVIQHFQTLIQEQETQTPQPHFAQTYAWLGDQYQKAGQSDNAKAVWQRGAALFPADERLRTKLNPKP